MLFFPTLVYTDACKYRPFAVICISRLFLKIWYPLNLFSRRKRAGERHFHSYQLRQLQLMLMHHYQRQLCSHHSSLSHFASFASNRNCNSHQPHHHQHLQTQKFAHELLRSSFGGSCLAQVFQLIYMPFSFAYLKISLFFKVWYKWSFYILLDCRNKHTEF